MASVTKTCAAALVIQHEIDGPAGLVGEALVRRGYDLHVVQVLGGADAHSNVTFPDPTAFDLVLALGSVHSVYDTATIGSWIDRELDLLRAAVDATVPIFGICFGAQALAAALGGSVERSPLPEIGWVHVDSDVPDAVAPGPWFTWHLDRCVLPEAVTELARTEAGPQAFRCGRVAAVQFHPEVDHRRVEHWVRHCPDDYWAKIGIDPETMLDAFAGNASAAQANVDLLVDWFLDEVAG